MDDSRRPSKWQDDAVQAADTHCGLAARGRETEKKRRRPEERKGARGQARRHECTEKHEDTINDVEKGTARVSESCVQFLEWYPPVLGLVAL